MANELKPCPFCGGSNLDTYYCDIEGWIAHIKCDDCDDMIGPMSEFKYENKEEAYEDASKRWDTRPAAPVEGLKTVGFDLEEIRKAVFGDVGDEPDVYSDYDYLCELSRKMREAVRFCSQAEAIIAAKDAKIADLENELSSFRSSFKEQTSLKADNAALTARVKELEHDLNGAKGNAKNASSNSIYWRGQYEALKAENEKKQTVKWDADGF